MDLLTAITAAKSSMPVTATAKQVYERLLAEPSWAAANLTLSEVKRGCSKLAKLSAANDSSGGTVDGELPEEVHLSGPGRAALAPRHILHIKEADIATTTLRFEVGTRVECKTNDAWKAGTIAKQFFRQPSFPPGMFAPYQIRLDNDHLIFAPVDEDRVVREYIGDTGYTEWLAPDELMSKPLTEVVALLKHAGSDQLASYLLYAIVEGIEKASDVAQDSGVARMCDFVRAGGVDGLMTALRRFSDSDVVILPAMVVIDCLCFEHHELHSVEAKRQLFNAGAAAVVVRCVSRTRAASVQTRAILAITALTAGHGQDDAEFTQPLIEAGAYTAILAAMTAHPDDLEQSIAALRGVGNLSGKNLPAAPARLLEAVPRVMRAHSSSGVALCKGLLSLANQSSHLRGEFPVTAATEGAVVAVQALAEHTQNLELCIKACMFLCNLLSIGLGDAVANASAKTTVRRCSAAHPRELQLQDLVTQLLSALKRHSTGELAEQLEADMAAGGAGHQTRLTEHHMAARAPRAVVSALTAFEEEEGAEGGAQIGAGSAEHEPHALSGQRVRIPAGTAGCEDGSFGRVEGVVTDADGASLLYVQLEGQQQQQKLLVAMAGLTVAEDQQSDADSSSDLKFERDGPIFNVEVDEDLPECQQNFSLLERCCSECGLPPQNGSFRLSLCSQCEVTRYCSRDHQAKAWKHGGHKRTCGQPLPTPSDIAVWAKKDPLRLLRVLREFGRACPQLVVSCSLYAMQEMHGADQLPLRSAPLSKLIAADAAHAKALIDAMVAFPALEGVQVSAVPLLATMFCFARQHVLEHGGVAALLGGMDALQTKAVSVTGVVALKNMMYDEQPQTDVKQAIVAARGVAVLCAAMRAHASSEMMATQCVWILFFVAANDQRAKSQCINHGAPVILAEAVSAYPGNVDLVSHAIGAVRNICAGDSEVCIERKRACIRAGLLPLVLRGMRQHLRDEDTQEYGLSALVNLISRHTSEAHEAVAATAGGHKALLLAVVLAMRAHPSTERMLPLFGGSAISMYTIRGNTVERELALTAIRVGAVSALNDVLLSTASGRGAMDLSPCAGVLINLLSADPHGTEMQAAFRKAGVLITTLTVLRRQPDCALAKELLMKWVHAIMPPEVDRDHARRAVVVEEISVATEAAGFKGSEAGALLEKLFA